MITIDTLRADRVGVCGGPADVTPALDALGRAGTVFTDATAHVPLTLPSHVSILTGRYPLAHGVHDNSGFVLKGDVPTLAGVLKASGYHTAAFVSSYVLRGSTGLARGFDVFDDRVEGLGRTHLAASGLERKGPEVARIAAAWLASAPRPLFLWVHFYDPHAPYDAPPAFRARFPNRPYDAEVATSDFGVSSVLGALSPDQRANTLVVATGDHGESLGEHGEPEHGILLYDATLRVPLIFQGPAIPSGLVLREQARHVDVVPTVLELLHVESPKGIDGVSLVARMSGGGSRTEAPLSYAESRFGELHFGWSPLRSVRDGTWKYIQAPAPELYELTKDRVELNDRHQERAETAAALARALDNMTRAAAVGPMSARPSAEAAEALRGLGYVSGRVDIGETKAGDALDPKREIGRYVAYVNAFNDGLALLEADKIALAESRFRALAREYPRAFEAHQFLARTLAARRASKEAVREYDLAIKLAPGEPGPRFDQARSLAALGRFDEAFAQAAEGARLDPESFYTPLTEAIVALAARQNDRAEAAFNEAVRRNPQSGVAHFELGRIAEGRGDLNRARAEYQLALDGDATLDAARRALEKVSR